MIFAVAVIFSGLVLSGVSSQSVGECQPDCRNFDFPPTRCVNAAVIVDNMFNRLSTTLDPYCNRSRDTIERLLEIACSTECLSAFQGVLPCFSARDGYLDELSLNRTLQVYCPRHEDGTFCPVKVLEEATGTPQRPVPLCATDVPGQCNSTCQESYRNLRSRLGCCGGTLYNNPFRFTRVRIFFDSCNVTLDDSCPAASGAAMLYLSLLLAFAASLFSITIV